MRLFDARVLVRCRESTPHPPTLRVLSQVNDIPSAEGNPGLAVQAASFVLVVTAWRDGQNEIAQPVASRAWSPAASSSTLGEDGRYPRE